MPGRKSSGGYRYGFNGKENDNEVKGEGNQQDYGMRIYDGRIGKFLSVDPITSKYPYLTPYQFASNRPIDGIDLDGLEFFKKDNNQYTIDYRPVLKAPDVVTGIDNAAHNVIGFVWNGTAGAVAEMAKSVNNYFAGGYKEKNNSPDPVYAFMEGTNEMFRYSTRTPLRQQLSAFVEAATDLKNYEIIPSLFIAHKFPANNGTIPSAHVATANVESKATKLIANKSNSAISESIVQQKLISQLGANEAILIKPRIYIGDGSSGKYAIPDFGVYNTKTGNFVKLIDAKDGKATFSKAQQQVNQYGGTFKGSSRATDAKPQTVAPNSIQVERTKVTRSN